MAADAPASIVRCCVFESDLVTRIMSKWLITRDFLRLARTTSGCLREVEASLDELDLGEKLMGTNKPDITDEQVASIARRFPCLRSLNFCGNEHVTDAAVFELARLSKLRELDISGCDITATGLAVLSQDLESLVLGDFTANNGTPQASETRAMADEDIIVAARRCSRLSSLDLSCMHGITNRAIITIADECAHLKSLDLSFCEITDPAIVHAAERCDLERLILVHCHVTEESIFALGANCPNLSELHVTRSPNYQTPGITDASILALARCARLETLDLAGYTFVSDRSIIPFSRICCNLQMLNLHNCAIDDPGVMSIAKNCPMLTCLNVGGKGTDSVGEPGGAISHISDISIVMLASHCPRLRGLSLTSSGVTDLFLRGVR